MGSRNAVRDNTMNWQDAAQLYRVRYEKAESELERMRPIFQAALELGRADIAVRAHVATGKLDKHQELMFNLQVADKALVALVREYDTVKPENSLGTEVE